MRKRAFNFEASAGKISLFDLQGQQAANMAERPQARGTAQPEPGAAASLLSGLIVYHREFLNQCNLEEYAEQISRYTIALLPFLFLLLYTVFVSDRHVSLMGSHIPTNMLHLITSVLLVFFAFHHTDLMRQVNRGIMKNYRRRAAIYGGDAATAWLLEDVKTATTQPGALNPLFPEIGENLVLKLIGTQTLRFTLFVAIYALIFGLIISSVALHYSGNGERAISPADGFNPNDLVTIATFVFVFWGAWCLTRMMQVVTRTTSFTRGAQRIEQMLLTKLAAEKERDAIRSGSVEGLALQGGPDQLDRLDAFVKLQERQLQAEIDKEGTTGYRAFVVFWALTVLAAALTYAARVSWPRDLTDAFTERAREMVEIALQAARALGFAP